MDNRAYQISKSFLETLYERLTGSTEAIVPDDNLSDVFLRGDTPSREHLAEMINVAHWASYTTEEGHPVIVSLIYRELPSTNDAFHFDIPLDFCDKTLGKLGPALTSPHADIAVWPDGSGQLKIWGFTSIPDETTIKSDLWVQILGPGRILIMYSGRAVAALSANQAVFIDPRSFLHSIMPKIVAQAKASDITLTNLFRYNAILKIAQQMRLHGRGGTVLIVPAGKSWEKSIATPVKYTGGTDFLDAEAMVPTPSRTELADAENLTRIVSEMNLTLKKDWLQNWQQVQRQCSRIARLTAVDGALVMTFDRYVHCFGAKIKALDPRSAAGELSVIEPFENRPVTRRSFSDLSGTRHLSAAQFAFDQPEALVIVASQDGNVTFFTKTSDGKGILTVQQAEMALLHEGLGSLAWNLSFFSEMGWLEKGVGKNEKGYLAGVLAWMRNAFRKDG
ncbi:putative sensor domain DACNV-containing protein [Desulfofustis glycolicus]|uniref:Probable sensor domain-containing protein n=1 Tax=Desulfofustis glycolicus DSM 9705 TaxID=1121409 RepID=A0A1M5VZD1_9BACT|nr:hypothetical protein [Desulfofustis glycolicus]MCB2215180.1 hypothetical protein [Desulfobulbaceae bacterium]SHH80283.1 hypothetical protein SAMN02745124_01962 [Desulfofustis glycolicus DSM 9705]